MFEMLGNFTEITSWWMEAIAWAHDKSGMVWFPKDKLYMTHTRRQKIYNRWIKADPSLIPNRRQLLGNSRTQIRKSSLDREAFDRKYLAFAPLQKIRKRPLHSKFEHCLVTLIDPAVPRSEYKELPIRTLIRAQVWNVCAIHTNFWKLRPHADHPEVEKDVWVKPMIRFAIIWASVIADHIRSLSFRRLRWGSSR